MKGRQFIRPRVVDLSKLTFTILCISLEIAIVTMAFVLYLQTQ